MTAITVRLPDIIVNELKSYAKKFWISQKEIIEQWLKNWIEKKKKQQLINQMNNYASLVNSDKEEINLSNTWINDYLTNLTKEDDSGN